MLCRWPTSSNSATSTDSQASFPWLGFGVSLVIPGRWSSPSSGAEKNALWRLRSGVLDVLRPAAATSPGSLLRRQAGLPRLLSAPGLLWAVRRREERTAGLAGRQPAVHQAIRLLRGPALSRNGHQGSRPGTLPRLAP